MELEKTVDYKHDKVKERYAKSTYCPTSSSPTPAPEMLKPGSPPGRDNRDNNPKDHEGMLAAMPTHFWPSTSYYAEYTRER
jgi:hypothetical protein